MAKLICTTGYRGCRGRFCKGRWTIRGATTLVAAALCAGICTPQSLLADVRHWDNETGSNRWFEPDNWNPNGTPAPGDHLMVFFGQPYSHQPITSDNDGSITLDGAGTVLDVHVSTTQSMTIGSVSRGTLNVQNGAVLSAGRTIVGLDEDSRGAVMVQGAGSRLDSALTVGSSGMGSVFVSEGASISGEMSLGHLVGSEGRVTIKGAGTSGSFDKVDLGTGGMGQLSISDQADVSVAEWLRVGQQSTADNRLTVQAATLTIGQDLTVGAAGNGMLSISEGGRVTSGLGLISSAVPTGGEGAVVVNGEGSVWEVLDGLAVGGDLSGARGPGHLAVIRGGSMIVDERLKVWPTGDVLLNQGTIQAEGLDVLGSLQGAGRIVGDLTLGAGGVLSPGLQLAGPIGPGGPGGPNGPHQQSGHGALALAGLFDELGAEAADLSAIAGLSARELATVPEPSAWGLLLAAVASLAVAGRAARRGFAR